MVPLEVESQAIWKFGRILEKEEFPFEPTPGGGERVILVPYYFGEDSGHSLLQTLQSLGRLCEGLGIAVHVGGVS